MPIKANEQITIIYSPVVDYSLLLQRPQQLLKAMAKITNVRTIFISSEIYKKLSKPITEMSKDFYVVSANSNYQDLAKGKVIHWCSYPEHIDYPFKVKIDYTVFDAIDNPVEEFASWGKKIDYAIGKSDMISCTANILYNQHKDKNMPIFMCPNGGDYNHFKKAQKKLDKPIDFPKYDKKDKVVGFYGAMAQWVNYDIIEKIASKYKVVLIGYNQYYPMKVQHSNVVNIAHKDYTQLPYYLSHFDVAMIPFKLTEMIKGCDPVKLQEYLSSGKPVIATEIEDVVANFSDVVDFINIENCLEVIDRVLQEDSKIKQKARIDTAINNSWDNRAETAIANINEHLIYKKLSKNKRIHQVV